MRSRAVLYTMLLPMPSPAHTLPRPPLAGWPSAAVRARTAKRSKGRLGLLAAAIVLLAAADASAVLIATGDGTGNTTAPPADPGFANVGTINQLSGVYVRNGWVLTANHVGENPIDLDGAIYEPIPGSGYRFQNPDGSLADLLAFKLATPPPLPDLQITNAPASSNTLLTLVGAGYNRGEATQWMGVDGWTWGGGSTMRWGTNRISQTDQFSLNTWSFWTIFDDLPPRPGQHEADLVPGDSGGAAFLDSGASAELVGILFARATSEGQPSGTSVYGNAGLIVDLFRYRDEILSVIDQPDCSNGLDDDGDGLADHPSDPGCSSPTDASEREVTLACDNGLDDDGDGTIDLADIGCTDPADTDERGATAECDNGIDDDGDLLADFPADPGCLHPSNVYELPEPGFGSALALATLGLALATRGRPSHR